MDNGAAILMIKALDGLAARLTATSENIANASTPNYRPLRVTFENALAEAASKGDAAVRDVVPQLERVASGTVDAEVRIDQEAATASMTALRYSALIEMLNRQGQIASLPLTGNS